jgi:hypothetical protein
VLYGELGDLAGPGLVAHRGQQLPYVDTGGRHPLVESELHRAHNLLEGEAVAQVLLRGVPHLGVHDAVTGQVLDALAGHPGDVVGALHHRNGVVERLEVAHQRAAVRGLGEPPP